MAEKFDELVAALRQANQFESSAELLQAFRKFDKDSNGYIEARELDSFLSLALKEGTSTEDSQRFKEQILNVFDTNYDGKLSLTEMASLLPTKGNILNRFTTHMKVTRAEAEEIFVKYDRDEDGKLNFAEIQGFMKDLLEAQGKECTPQHIADYCEAMMDLYDKNKSGTFERQELLMILPVRSKKDELVELYPTIAKGVNKPSTFTSSVEFMKGWKEMDKDRSGFIEASELMNFLNLTMPEMMPREEIEKYKDLVLQGTDVNKDGKLGLHEMAQILLTEENFLNEISLFQKATKADVEKVFEKYDRDQSGQLENEEIDGVIKDLMDLRQPGYELDDLNQQKTSIMKVMDADKSGTITKDEFVMFFSATC